VNFGEAASAAGVERVVAVADERAHAVTA